MKELKLDDFPIKSYDKVRYADTDRQGHVNNAVFSTFLETGRVDLLLLNNPNPLPDGVSFVIAGIQLNYINEIHFPGLVELGTGILKIGNSSIKLYQHLFQNGKLVADAETVIVQVGGNGKSLSLDDKTRAYLDKMLLNNQ
ncbi:MAG: acyl-CoA thioesterase [Bacteroidetes bacterium]|nr:acyl-CoA thioesterase [Bacteroidota bacterium]